MTYPKMAPPLGLFGGFHRAGIRQIRAFVDKSNWAHPWSYKTDASDNYYGRISAQVDDIGPARRFANKYKKKSRLNERPVWVHPSRLSGKNNGTNGISINKKCRGGFSHGQIAKRPFLIDDVEEKK